MRKVKNIVSWPKRWFHLGVGTSKKLSLLTADVIFLLYPNSTDKQLRKSA